MNKQPPSRQRRATNAFLFGALIGAIGGAIIGLALFNRLFAGALLGAVIYGAGEALTDYMRRPGASKPVYWHILVTALFGTLLGSAVFLLRPETNLVLTGLFIGLILGLFAVHWQNILLGGAVGLLLGFAAYLWPQRWHPALLGAAVALVYSLLGAWLFRDRRVMSIAAERVPAEEIRYVVPFEAHGGYIGADYFQGLARESDGRFQRNLHDIGIVASLDDLSGPRFDPRAVSPLIREFYEHTSRFKLAIVPEWQPLMKPAYLLYKQLIARRIGQANLPFDQQEAQRGIVSYIDTIELNSDDPVIIRGWVRAYQDSGEAIYVGIYTTIRYEEIGYVSVGFPLPEANFTATLLPANHNGTGFLLSSRGTGFAFPGHYLTFKEGGNLTVLALESFGEEIEVYVENGAVRADHRFYLGDRCFLTLYYSTQRVQGSA